MAKKESDERPDIGNSVSKTGFTNFLINTLKIFGFIFLLPIVYGFSEGFFRQFSRQPITIVNSFIYAVCLYLLIHIFLFKPTPLFKFGERIVDKIFIFTGPLRRFFGYGVAFYCLIFFIYYFVLINFFQRSFDKENIVFMLVFFFIMHLSLVAEELKEQHKDLFGISYLFYLSSVYIINLIILGLFLSYLLEKFSFMEFIRFGYNFVVDAITLMWQQLFVINK